MDKEILQERSEGQSYQRADRTTKRIEKDFLKENVLRLKEIQAKCRGQESRLTSGLQPIKAIRPTVKELAVHNKMSNNDSKTEDKLKLRNDSAHSDYFSLPDDTSNDTNLNSFHSNTEVFKLTNCSDTENKIVSRTCATSENNAIMKTSDTKASEHTLLSQHGKANMSDENPLGQCGTLDISLVKSDDRCKNLNQAPSLRSSRLGNIIRKIKSKQPACDISTEVIWREIKRDHQALLPLGDSCSAITPITSTHNRNTQTTCMPLSVQNRKITSRPRSLDRLSSSKQNNKLEKTFGSTYTLVSRPKSSSSSCKVLDNEQNSCSGEIDTNKNYPKNHSESLPNLREYCHQKDNTTNPVLRESPLPVSETEDNRSWDQDHLQISENFHIKDRPNSDAMENDEPKKDLSFVANEKESFEKASAVRTPVLQRRENAKASLLSLQQKQGALLKSKSSGNLHLCGEPPPTYKRGQIPKYLKHRKEEAQRRLEAAAAVDPMCPKGHTPVPDHERRNTLHLLKKGQADIMNQLSSLPLSQDTLRVQKLKKDLEAKLSQIEDGIKIFSQPKVYVLNDE